MQTITLKLPSPHIGRTMGGQKRILSERKRFNIMDCGRRFGKTDLLEIIIHEPLVQGFPVGWFAPSYKYMNDAWDEIGRLYAPLITSKNKTDRKMEFVTKGVLEFWTLDKEGAGRTRKYKMIAIDEAARVKGLIDIFNYDLRPTLIDHKGSGFFASTPKGLNDFFKLWQMAGEDAEWARWQMPTSENPHLSLDEIESMRIAMPERVAKQELDAEFLEDGAFFQNVDQVCILESPDNPDNHTGHRFFAGLDWALTGDFTRLRVFCLTCKMAVDWWGGHRMDYSLQRGFIIDTLSKWPGVILLPERNSMGAPNIENLHEAGVSIMRGPDGGYGFYTNSSSKNELIMGLALAMDKKELRLPKEDADEMRAYEVEITAANPKFSAPKGQHDDRVMANALAWWAASQAQKTWWMS